MPLTDTSIRAVKATDKVLKLFDGGGLFLQVTPAGGKWWRLKYRFAGKEKLVSLGTYPETSLKEARDRRDAAKKLLSAGIDPSADKREGKLEVAAAAVNTFEAVSRRWFEANRSNWVEDHAKKIISRLERDVFPFLGKRPISDITPADVLEALGKIKNRGDESLGNKGRGLHETARRAFGNCGMIFRYAVARNIIPSDPTRDLKGEFPKPAPKHFSAITDPEEIAQLMRGIEGYRGSAIVQAALKLSPLLFVRPGELRTARWADIDLDAGEWRYLVTKTMTAHIVPLCRQAVDVLRELRPFTGNCEYVFPAARNFSRPMSNNAILAAIRAMGFGPDKMTGHGFRAMARTRLHETLKMPPEVIERQLAHDVPDMNGTAYNRTQFLEERRRMMQEWADYLEGLKNQNIRPGRVA